MLKPAIKYKEELDSKFADVLYTEEYFLYTGYSNCGTIPQIKLEDHYFHYVILNTSAQVIGYLTYYINPTTDSVSRFGLFSFDKGNPIIGKDLYEKLQELVNTHHRIEWYAVSGNPVVKHYDKYCKKFNGNKMVLHDVIKDIHGKYRDSYIYEIIKTRKEYT